MIILSGSSLCKYIERITYQKSTMRVWAERQRSRHGPSGCTHGSMHAVAVADVAGQRNIHLSPVLYVTAFNMAKSRRATDPSHHHVGPLNLQSHMSGYKGTTSSGGGFRRDNTRRHYCSRRAVLLLTTRRGGHELHWDRMQVPIVFRQQQPANGREGPRRPTTMRMQPAVELATNCRRGRKVRQVWQGL
jgi:hypothetical protein